MMMRTQCGTPVTPSTKHRCGLYEELRGRAERLSRARLIVKKLPWYGTARWKLLCELDAIPVDIRGEANDSIKSVEYRRER